MARRIGVIFLVLLSISCWGKILRNTNYINNQAPLLAQPYTALPLGNIKPKGMLHKMLEIQRDGLTGHMDSIYAVVCGDNNGWLGGTGDGWERGPYWIDGLVSLAYILDDAELKAKVQKWINWSIENLREDGYFGPKELEEGYVKIKGIQQGMRDDWWPKEVMLKILQQYYTATDDFLRKQYYQQTNQIMITNEYRHFDCDYEGSTVFGTTTGYPCCVTNMHQGWPKFVRNLWYATADNGLAALVYGASEVNAKVGNGVEVTFSETTNYPFSENIQFTYNTEASVFFPLHLRIPEWCKKASVKINGEVVSIKPQNGILVLNRKWEEADRVDLHLPMDVRFSRWYERSLGIERGPLVYALKIEEEWKEVKTKAFEHSYLEVLPKTPWNYCIPKKHAKAEEFKVIVEDNVADMPWNLENAPIRMEVLGKRVPFWTVYEGSTGKMPYSPHSLRVLGTPKKK